MYEQFIGKRVKIYLEPANDKAISWTGEILEVGNTHLRFREREGSVLLLKIDSLQQVIPLEDNGND